MLPPLKVTNVMIDIIVFFLLGIACIACIAVYLNWIACIHAVNESRTPKNFLEFLFMISPFCFLKGLRYWRDENETKRRN